MILLFAVMLVLGVYLAVVFHRDQPTQPTQSLTTSETRDDTLALIERIELELSKETR